MATLEENYALILYNELYALQSNLKFLESAKGEDHEITKKAREDMQNLTEVVTYYHEKARREGIFPFTQEEVILVQCAIIDESFIDHANLHSFSPDISTIEVELLLLSFTRPYARRIIVRLQQGKQVICEE